MRVGNDNKTQGNRGKNFERKIDSRITKDLKIVPELLLHPVSK
jgi:hypothetical protein